MTNFTALPPGAPAPERLILGLTVPVFAVLVVLLGAVALLALLFACFYSTQRSREVRLRVPRGAGFTS